MSFISDLLSILSNFVIHTIQSIGYFGIFLLMTLESACIPIPSEVIMPFSGFLVTLGKFNFIWVVLIGSIGNLAGSLLAYWVGAVGGRPLVEKYGKYILVHTSELDHADKWFKKSGDFTVFTSRLLPVVRTFISLPAGISKMPIWKFIIYTFLGSLPFNLALTYIGYVLGQNWSSIRTYFHRFDIIILILIILGIIYWIIRQIKHFEHDRKIQTQK